MRKLIFLVFLILLNLAHAQQLPAPAASTPTLAASAPTLSARPDCNYNNYSFNGTVPHFAITDFYTVGKQEQLLNKPIKQGSILYYSQFNRANLLASTAQDIDNKDVSPLNPNWHWQANETKKVGFLISWDRRNWWYFIVAHTFLGTTNYWVSGEDGWLCGNPLDNTLNGSGMPRIYQQTPLKFTKQPIESEIGKLSLAISVKSIDGATGNILVSVNRDGGSIFSRIVSVDLLGGSFNVLGVNFKTERVDGDTVIKQITTPEHLSIWLSGLLMN